MIVQKIKCSHIFWDIDGTLFSAYSILHSVYDESIKYINRKYGFKLSLPSLSDIIACVGNRPQLIFSKLFPNNSDIPESVAQEFMGRILEYLVRKIERDKQGEYYPQVFEVLQELHRRGHISFTASNGRLPYIRAILTRNNTAQFFSEIRAIDSSDDEMTPYRDKSHIIEDTLERYDIRRDHAVLIGDRELDKTAAKKCRIGFIAVNYGHGSPNELASARYKIEKINDLLEMLMIPNGQ